MGSSQIKNLSISLIIWGVVLVAIYIYTTQKTIFTGSHDINSSKSVDKLSAKFSNPQTKKHEIYELNKTLQKEYISVAKEIEEFIKRQRAKREKDTNTTHALSINKTNSSDKNISSKKREENVTKESKKIKKSIVPKVSKIKRIKNKKELPKLAIIIDDVGFESDIDMIKKIPFAVTPSIFPPTKHYPKTPKIAKKVKHYMIHVPMEAYKYKNMAEEAIKVSDKIEEIDKKIKKIKKEFPRAVAINNHTGSKFTCDFDAMEEFFTVLNRYDIEFIDSRTSSGSQCVEAGKLLNKKVLKRDVFLDNKADEEYIRGQLKKAVKIAKKNGQAIAICHPRELTFKVLMNSKDILKDVKLVYIDELL